ncbi:glycoside hydrolase family 30 protein [Chitinophaga varians]|uniref:glycoside hydrolase family 30 protein n=1 Tax=Chitinophaga varians TaxID=2202339 RepID=UPI00165FB2D5|nr:glycoside hydrolase family 30 beta sandwich domain-containing protein [Chitinophaga varians]MBC9909447.1 glucosylceramidase [Chitinophaga varians]
MKRYSTLFFGGIVATLAACSGSKQIAHAPVQATVTAFITSSDQRYLLKEQTGLRFSGTNANGYTTITVDPAQTFQPVEGFGYTLTGGSAQLINAMDPAARQQLLQEVFGAGSQQLGVSYLRISIGASDLNATVFSYDDVPAGETDVPLAHFSLAPDMAGGTGLIPLLQEILQINPKLSIMAAPWSPPVWMKDNGASKGGSLLPTYYHVYAQYFVKYIQAMKAAGIPIAAITPQNEPLHPGNNPSLKMLAGEQRDFIKGHLGPAFAAANIHTKIVVYDHNCDRPDYPLTILADTAAARYVHGSAFHLYAGDISALSAVQQSAPDKAIYFTEQWTGSKETFDNNLRWHIKNVIIGAMRNHSRTALEWNLANDTAYKPHTPGGCTQCKGAFTINGNDVKRNVAYYIIAHASRFVPAGAVRIGSNSEGSFHSVAFQRPDGKKVLIVLNDNSIQASFNLRYQNKQVVAILPAASVGTYIF